MSLPTTGHTNTKEKTNMATASDLLADAFEDATPAQAVRRVYVPHGRSILEIERCEQKTKRASTEQYVLTTFEFRKGLRGEALSFPRGESCTYFQGFKFMEADMAALKGFILAAYQSLDPKVKKVSKQMYLDAVGEKNALKGAVVVAEAWEHISDKAAAQAKATNTEPKGFTKYNWRPATPEEIASLSVDDSGEEVSLDDI